MDPKQNDIIDLTNDSDSEEDTQTTTDESSGEETDTTIEIEPSASSSQTPTKSGVNRLPASYKCLLGVSEDVEYVDVNISDCKEALLLRKKSEASKKH